MFKAVFFLILAGLMTGCSEYAAIRKTNKDFMKLCESVAPTEGGSETNGVDGAKLKPRLVAPGMQVVVTVAEDSSLNRGYLVSPSCTVDFAGAGRIEVCGLTPDELAMKIREPLERDYFQRATVTVSIESAGATGPGGAGGVIYLIGDIGRPGPMLLPRDQAFTLTKAIIAAGGFSTFAKGNSVRVLRYCEDGKKYETYVDVDRIMKNGEFERDITLRPNDWVIVGRKIVSF